MNVGCHNVLARFFLSTIPHLNAALCPSGERDEAWPGKDLMEYFQLKRLFDFSMRALEKPSAYLKGVPGDTTLYRCALFIELTTYLVIRQELHSS